MISRNFISLDHCERMLVGVASWVEKVLGKIQSGILEKGRTGKERSIFVDGLNFPSTKPKKMDLDGWVL